MITVAAAAAASGGLPGLSHGLAFMQDDVAKWWFFGLPISYLAIAGLFRACKLCAFKLKISDKSGKLVDSNTRASDDLAFEIVAGFCVTYLAAAGIIGRYSLFGVDVWSKLSQDKFYGQDPYVTRHLIIPMIIYQLWDVVLCLQLDVLRSPALIAHHLVAAALAYFALNPYLHHSALFFFGIVEVTSIPLTVYDTCQKFERLGWKSSIAFHASSVAFALSFIAVRMVMWVAECAPFWTGSVDLLVSGRAHSSPVVVFFLLSNVFMTILQIVWGKQVVVGLLQVLGVLPPSQDSSSDDKAK